MTDVLNYQMLMTVTVINFLSSVAYWISAHNLDLLSKPYFQSFSTAPIVSTIYECSSDDYVEIYRYVLH